MAAIYFPAAFVFRAQLGRAGWFHPTLLLYVGGGVVLIVASGSLYKIFQLRSGGKAVAGLLGAEPVEPGTCDPAERRLLNVVEEMALASGVAVPTVYVLREERGINAFAAGFTVRDAVIGVTQGCLSTLPRDELQGVIAHEFSHILNSDMCLNVRLIRVNPSARGT